MGSPVRLGGASALVVLLSACVPWLGGPAGSGAGIVGQTEAGAEYADFLTARYASLTHDPVAAARYYRRAAERAPADSALLDRAVLATLVEGDADAAARFAAGADARTLAAAPFARLALIADDIAAGRDARALKRLDASGLGALNDDIARGLSAWLTAREDTDKGVARAVAPDNRRRLAGEFDGIQALILASAGRDREALAKFADEGAPRARAPFLAAAHARLAAVAGDPARARDILAASVAANGPAPETRLAAAMLDGREPLTPPRLSTRQGAAAAIDIVSSAPATRSNTDLSVAYLSLALHIDPEFDAARLRLAGALRNAGRTQEAIDQFRRIAAGSPAAAMARIGEARLLRQRGETDAALAAGKAALAASRSREMLLEVADLDRDAGRAADAERLYSEAIAADAAAGRGDWRALFARASVRETLGRWPEAEADLKRALQLEPGQPDVLNFLGYAWVDRGENVEEGFKLIKQAIQARPDRGYIVDSLGWAHYRRGDYEEAVTALEKAAELDPADAVITGHLGDAYWRVGRRVEAGFEWRRALELGPDARQAADLRQKLADGLPALASRAAKPERARP